MAFVTADRVKDTSTTTGTGNFTVSGTSPTGYRTFSTVLSAADTFYYCIQGQTTAEWEVGLGTYSSANVFARTTILSSSNSNLVVSFQAGVKNVFITLAADKTLQIGPSSTPVAGSVPYGTGTTLAYTAAGTAGQVLTSGGAGSPTWTAVSGTGTVTSIDVSGGTTGLSASGGPVTTSGTITLAGTLAATNGGTGITSPGANGNVLTSNGSAWVSSPAAGGSGTVTSVNVSGGTTGLTASGGPITSSGTITLAGTLAIANGGTNGTTTAIAGGISYGTGTAYAFSSAGTSGQVLTSGGAGAPTWTTVTGTGTVTSVAQSFTGGLISVSGSPITAAGILALTVAGTSGGIPYFSSPSAWASSGTLTANGVVYGGGATVSPGSTAAGTTGQVLIATTSNAPSWGQVSLTAGVTGQLPVTNGGTGVATRALGDLNVGSGTNTTTNLAIGTTGQILTVSGGTAAWASALTPTTVNGLTLAALSTGFTVAGGTTSKTLTVSQTMTLTSLTSGTTMTFPPASASIGYLEIPQNAQTTAYTLVLADSGKHIYMASGQAATLITIPANSSVAFPIGTAVTFINSSTNAMTIGITTDTLTLSPTGTSTGVRTVAQYGMATAVKITNTLWYISGTGLT